MQEYLKKIPKEISGIIACAQEVTRTLSISAYLVGGFVRDLFLGVPNLDVDIVVEGDALNFAEKLCAKLNAKLIKHRRFGTATLILPNKLKMDLATARKETYPHPGALPEVTPGSIRDDLRRRDFSINAMAISIGQEDYGRLIDFFNSINDLKKGYIRVLHDLSFMDDPTRTFRAIRFKERYGFSIEPHTLYLLKEALKKDALSLVDKQRIRDELILLLKEKEPLKYIRTLSRLIGLEFLNKRIKLDKSKWNFLKKVQKEIFWFSKNFPRKRILDIWLMYLVALLDGLRLKEIKEICREFSLRMGETKRIYSYAETQASLDRKLSMRNILPSQIYACLEPLSYEVILLIKAKSANPLTKKHIEDFFKVYNGTRLYTSGEDLKKIGVKPSPYFKHILDKTLYAKIDHKLLTKEAELLFIKKMLAKHK